MPAMLPQLPPIHDPRFYATGGIGPGMALQQYLARLRNQPAPPPPIVSADVAAGAPLPNVNPGDLSPGSAPGDSAPNTGPPGVATGLADLGSQFVDAVAGNKTANNPRGFSVVPGFVTGAFNAFRDFMGHSDTTPTAAQSATMEAQDAAARDSGGMGGIDGGNPSGGGMGADPDGNPDGYAMGGAVTKGRLDSILRALSKHGADYRKGGAVTKAKLAKPDPAGPDDGIAALDAGEHVWTRDEVKASGGHGAQKKLRKAALAGELVAILDRLSKGK